MTVQVLSGDQASVYRRLAQMTAQKQTKYRSDSNANTLRRDSRYEGGGDMYHFARELEHVYSDVLKEDYPDNNALSLFPIDRSVKPGARTHTVYRQQQQGEAKIHRGRANDTPTVNVSRDKEEFPVLHYVIGVDWDVFEEAESNFASSPMLKDNLVAARDVLLEKANEMTWYGSDEDGAYGIFNYPFLAKRVMSGVVFKTGGDPEAMLSALQSLIDTPGVLSKGKGGLRPNTVVVSIRMDNAISNTYFPGTNETVKQRLIATKGVRVEAAWEMQESGPGGTDQVFVYKAGDKRSVANVIPSAFNQLPTQRTDYTYQIPCYMSHGGVIMRKVIMNILGYATVE